MATHFERANVLMDQHRYDLAIEEFRLALAEDPDNEWAHGYLSWCLRRQQNYSAALTAAETAIGLAPDESRFHYYHARIYLDLRQLDLAQQAIDQALALNPNDADYYWCSSKIYYDQNDDRQALITSEQGLAIDSENQFCQEARLLALYALKSTHQNNVDIKVEAEQLLTNYPNNNVAHTIIAQIYLSQSNFKAAEDHFRIALCTSPSYSWAHKGLKEAIQSRYLPYRLLQRLKNWVNKMPKRLYNLTDIKLPKIGLFISQVLRLLIKVLILIVVFPVIVFGEILVAFICPFDPDFRQLSTPSEFRSGCSCTSILISIIGGVLPAIIYWQVAWLVIPAVCVLINLLVWLKHYDDSERLAAWIIFIPANLAIILWFGFGLLPVAGFWRIVIGNLIKILLLPLAVVVMLIPVFLVRRMRR
jgi:tetratricopeptide (TPR) repeat protein